jgi:hypothetical protein
VFPWAHFRSTKSAVKLHTLLDLKGNIPTFIHISDGKLSVPTLQVWAWVWAGLVVPVGLAWVMRWRLPICQELEILEA